MDSLSKQLPVPEDEWKAIEWFHGLPPDDTVQEIRNRRQSETTLWTYWSDEVTRARAYRRKALGLAMDGTRKKKNEVDPPRYVEFFRWKYGDECQVPPWRELDDQQRAEYFRDFEIFTAAVAAPAEVAPA